MIDLYVTLIKLGDRVLSDVPEGIREEVRKELFKLGLDAAGEPLEPQT